MRNLSIEDRATVRGLALTLVDTMDELLDLLDEEGRFDESKQRTYAVIVRNGRSVLLSTRPDRRSSVWVSRLAHRCDPGGPQPCGEQVQALGHITLTHKGALMVLADGEMSFLLSDEMRWMPSDVSIPRHAVDAILGVIESRLSCKG